MEHHGADGFGGWAPTWACLISQCGVPPGDAVQMRVDQANILISTVRRNQGWHVKGTPYALRDLDEKAEAEKPETGAHAEGSTNG